MLIEQHEASAGPLYMYIAPQNVHLGCGPDKATQGIQAPCETVAREPPRYRWHSGLPSSKGASEIDADRVSDGEHGPVQGAERCDDRAGLRREQPHRFSALFLGAPFSLGLFSALLLIPWVDLGRWGTRPMR